MPDIVDEVTSIRPSRSGRGLGVIGFALAVFSLIAIGLIATGIFDPKPYGPSLRAVSPGRFTVSGLAESVIPQPAPWLTTATPARFSVRLTAALQDGETDSGYGLVLGDGQSELTVALSPLGYVAVWHDTNDGERVSLLPWQTWPHVRGAFEANEIQLDVENKDGRAQVTAWVNRERLWQGELDRSVGETALWSGSFGDPAVVDFRTLEWFAVPETSDSVPTAEN